MSRLSCLSDRSRRNCCRAAFTLVELLAVMTIIGLIAATAALRFSGTTRAARLEWAVGRLVSTDGGLRSHARDHTQPAQLEFDVGTGRLRRVLEGAQQQTTTVELGRNVRVSRFVSATRDVSGGRIAVDYTAEGTSPSFAVELKSAASGSAWLVFAARTGQVTRLEEERDVTGLLRAIPPEGIDSR